MDGSQTAGAFPPLKRIRVLDFTHVLAGPFCVAEPVPLERINAGRDAGPTGFTLPKSDDLWAILRHRWRTREGSGAVAKTVHHLEAHEA